MSRLLLKTDAVTKLLFDKVKQSLRLMLRSPKDVFQAAKQSVFGPIRHHKIGRIVVQFLAILMVHNFVIAEWPAKDSFHNTAVFDHKSPLFVATKNQVPSLNAAFTICPLFPSERVSVDVPAIPVNAAPSTCKHRLITTFNAAGMRCRNLPTLSHALVAGLAYPEGFGFGWPVALRGFAWQSEHLDALNLVVVAAESTAVDWFRAIFTSTTHAGISSMKCGATANTGIVTIGVVHV